LFRHAYGEPVTSTSCQEPVRLQGRFPRLLDESALKYRDLNGYRSAGRSLTQEDTNGWQDDPTFTIPNVRNLSVVKPNIVTRVRTI